MTKLELFRSDLATLFRVLSEGTGWKLSPISVVVANDDKFASTFQRRGDMRVGTYDMVTRRFSAIWPADLPWPAEIERPAPAEIDGETLAVLGKRGRSIQKSDWPADQPWPADIPRPVASSPNVGGQGAE